MAKVRKHRPYLWYLMLPIVAAMTLALVASLAAVERAAVVAQLADLAAHGSPEEAMAAVGHMAAMPHPPLAALVTASASPDRAVAIAAQDAISDLLRTYDERVASKRNVMGVAAELAELAESLAQRQKDFSAADTPWIAKTTHDALRLTNRLPPRSAPALAENCDTILAAIEVVELAQMAFAPQRPAPFDPQIDLTQSAGSAAPIGLTDPTWGSTPIAPDQPDSDASPLQRERLSPSPSQPSAIASTLPSQSPDGSWRPEWSGQSPNATTPLPNDASIRILPPRAFEAGLASPTRPLTSAAPSPTPTPPVANRLADVEARRLLEQWRTANGANAAAIEQELARRGFGRLSKRLVDIYFSEVADHRLRLVDEVLSEPETGAQPWLMLLANDQNADVRLSAVTVMATSNDRALLEQAWQVAIRDRDPRIADLAERLRNRRGQQR